MMKVKFYRAFFGVLSNPGAGTCRFGLGFGGGGGGGGGAGFAPESLSLTCITSFSGWLPRKMRCLSRRQPGQPKPEGSGTSTSIACPW